MRGGRRTELPEKLSSRGHGSVAVRLVHQPEIVVDNAGSLQPLIGVVVTAVKKMRKILYDAHNQILSGCF